MKQRPATRKLYASRRLYGHPVKQQASDTPGAKSVAPCLVGPAAPQQRATVLAWPRTSVTEKRNARQGRSPQAGRFVSYIHSYRYENQAHSACDMEIQSKEDSVVHRISKVKTERFQSL